MEKTLRLSFEQRILKFFFLNRREDSDFLYYFRVSIGLLCLLHLLSYIGDFELLYVSDNIIPQDVMKVQKPWFIPNITSIFDFLHRGWNIPEAVSLTVFLGTYVFLCLSLTIGLLSRFSAIALLVLHLIIVKGSAVYSYGVDYFTSIALFYCVIFPVGHGKSIDQIIFKLKRVNPSPYRKILQLHLCIIYFASGIEKLVGSNWRNGESIWKSLHLPGFSSIVELDYSFLASFPIIAIIGGWFVVLIELLYPLFIWTQRYRNIGLALVCLMHLGILVSLGLYFFSAFMIVLNLTAFLNFAPSPRQKQ